MKERETVCTRVCVRCVRARVCAIKHARACKGSVCVCDFTVGKVVLANRAEPLPRLAQPPHTLLRQHLPSRRRRRRRDQCWRVRVRVRVCVCVGRSACARACQPGGLDLRGGNAYSTV